MQFDEKKLSGKHEQSKNSLSSCSMQQNTNHELKCMTVEIHNFTPYFTPGKMPLESRCRLRATLFESIWDTFDQLRQKQASIDQQPAALL